MTTISKYASIQDLIERNISLGARSTQGFHSVKCADCGDYKRRAGFKMDGGRIVYKCFNCGISAIHEDGTGRITNSFISLLEAFGCDEDEVRATVLSNVINGNVRQAGERTISTTCETIDTPSTWVGLDDRSEESLAVLAYAEKRGIDRKKLQIVRDTDLPGFMVIPFYYGGRLVFWQARDITGAYKPRYKSPSVPREAIVFNRDLLDDYKASSKLFVCEGPINASLVNGVALTNSSPSPAQRLLLSRTSRDLCVVVEHDTNGIQLGRWAIGNKMKITTTPPGCSDVAESVLRHGLLYTVHYLLTAQCEGAMAQTLLAKIVGFVPTK